MKAWPLVLCLLYAACEPGRPPVPEPEPLGATLEVLRPAVRVRAEGGAAHAVAAADGERLRSGSEVQVEHSALLRHDGGARFLLDHGSEVTVTERGLRLQKGRLWAQTPGGASGAVRLGEVQIEAGGGAGFEVSAAPARLTVVRGEAAYQGPQGTGVCRAGESLELGGNAQKPAPVTLWDDWTGGLAWPDPRRGGGAGPAEVAARRPGSLGEARFPLAVQRLQVRVRIEDDLATTTIEQTFFNPATDTLEGLYRLRIPERAILSRFAIDRRGRLVDGYVKEREAARQQYQQQVYEGSTHDPALLEWEAPGSYKARLYPLPPGATRRVLVTYSEWLAPHGEGGALRSYRLPLAATSGDAPLYQELDVEVDASDAGADAITSSLAAAAHPKERRVILQRTDYQPTADLVVQLRGAARKPDQGRSYRVGHVEPPRPQQGRPRAEDDYVLLRAVPVPPPAALTGPVPLDLVLLVDVSAATESTHLAMARTVAEALLRQLGPGDRAAVLGADLDARAVLPEEKAPRLSPASREASQRLLATLARTRTSGATDLGQALTQAAALLAPVEAGRGAAVVYIGDAKPTVGELDLPALRERLSRLPVPLRLYGVGIGSEADLSLLSGLCGESAGRAYRVADRAAAAEVALGMLQHLSRPAAFRVTAEPGPGVDRVYPRTPVALLAGEALPVLARLRQGVPASVTFSGVYAGQPFKRTVALEARRITDSSDLRLRWSEARLLHLLQSGASTEEVAELGVRQNLITPFTSFYVPSEDEVTLMERQLPRIRPAGCSRSAPSFMDREEKAASAPAVMAPRAQEAPPPPPGAVAPAEPPRPMRSRAARGEQMAKMDKNLLSDDAPVSKSEEAQSGERQMGKDNAEAKPEPMAESSKEAANLPAAPAASAVIGNLAADLKAEKKMAPAERRRNKAARAPADPFGGETDEDRRGGRFAQRGSGSAGDQTVLVGLLIPVKLRRGCSAASQLPLDERIELWRERLSDKASARAALEVLQDAQRGCELPRWTDRRELLRLMLRSCQRGGAREMVRLVQDLPALEIAQVEDGEFLRRMLLGEVRTPEDLRVVYEGLGLRDDEKETLVQEVVRGAKSADERLARIISLLQRFPDHLGLKLQRMQTEEQLGQREAALRAAEAVRADAYADAQARTAVGELLLRLGDEAAARRAFSEIVEFAPRDPLARRRLGDLYRAHRWYPEAYRQYQTLLTLSPGDPSVLVLQGLAASGAGHVEEALGLLGRAASSAAPGGESGVARAALLWQGALLAQLREAARQHKDDEGVARLWARARRSGVARLYLPVRVLLTFAHPEANLELKVGEDTPQEQWAQLGLLGWGSPRDASPADSYRIEVQLGEGGAPQQRYEAQLWVLVREGEKDERVFMKPLQLGLDRPVLRFTVAGQQLQEVAP